MFNIIVFDARPVPDDALRDRRETFGRKNNWSKGGGFLLAGCHR